jgi:hypothetical protein
VGSRYFRHRVECDENTQQDPEQARNLLKSNAMAHYRNVSAKKFEYAIFPNGHTSSKSSSWSQSPGKW